MLGHYLDLARRSFLRDRALTALMVLAIALGIGAAMTTLTVFHVLSADPLPGRSGHLYTVALDPYPLQGYVPGADPDDQLTRRDAEALLREARAPRQALMTGGSVAVQPQDTALKPFYTDARFATAGFFALFGTPFLAGGGWSDTDDQAHARVAVLAKKTADKLTAGRAADAVGRTVRLGAGDFRIVGVLDDWRPVPHFYDLNTGAYADTEQVYVPFSTSRDLKFPRSGSINCWDETNVEPTDLEANCTWIQYWVQLDDEAQRRAYLDAITAYAAQQHAAGRYQRPVNVRLRSVMEHLDHKGVIPPDVRLQTWLAFGFLLVCLTNTVGLLLAKCLRRAPEIGVRRALGASRRAIFLQFLVEAGVVGLAGGVAGLGLALLGLWGVRQNADAYAQLARLDLPMLAATFALALGASLAAGLLPAWRACRITPALQLKSQ
jgi:putative ABC transport system permease protein